MYSGKSVVLMKLESFQANHEEIVGELGTYPLTKFIQAQYYCTNMLSDINPAMKTPSTLNA